MGFLSFLKPAAKQQDDSPWQEETFSVVGVDYCMTGIKKLAEANPDWKLPAKALAEQDKLMHKIFRYNFIHKPLELIPEPSNPHDKNALMVQINGQKVGYISREENVHVKKILKQRRILFTSAFISGGEYKVVSQNGDTVKNEQHIRITVKIRYQ